MIIWVLLLILGYLVAPIMLVWGWARWLRERPRLWTIPSTLSFIGFLLASASALFALSMIAYAMGGGFEHTGSSPYYSPNYSMFFRWTQRGEALSLIAIAFGIGGVWQRSSLRWQAPASAAGMLAFWLIVTTWP